MNHRLFTFTSCRGLLLLSLAATLATTSVHAFNANLQARSFGSTNWVTGHISGWAELDLIPARIIMSGGPATNRTLTINFPRAGIQNLYSFTPSANVQIVSGPTLSAPLSGKWTYTLVVNLLDNQPGQIEFRMRLAAGAHRFTGSSLQVDGTPGFSKLFVFKPAAKPGSPDLGLRKSGPALANPGAIIIYSLAYSNRVNASTATGVQIRDILPANVTLEDCAGNCELVGNIITWDLGDIPRGASGQITYRVRVSDALTTGFTFQNNAVIEEAEDDANYADNYASVTTVVTGNCIAPSLVTDPTDAAHCPGATATFSVLANGSQPLYYQWRKDGAALAGATNAVLTLTGVTGSDSGAYDVIVSNLCGSVTSAAANLSVGGAVIVSPPVSDRWCAGDTATFAVIATGDVLAYQWRKDGTAIAGATNSWLELPAVSAADVGAYDVVITSSCGETISEPATLALRQPVSITQSPADVAFCDGDSGLLQVAATGDEPIVYQWRKDGVEIAGATAASLVVGQAGHYDVIVSGACDSVATSGVAVVTVYDAPAIAQGPADAAGCVGAPVTFSVSATGHGPLTYQWRKDGAAIAGAHDATYSIAAVTGADAGHYDVVVTGPCGLPAVSAPATLTILPAPAGSADAYETDEDVALSVPAPGVLGNDQATAVELDQPPAHGTVWLNSDGSLLYLPAAHHHGADSFTYRARNDCGVTAPVTVTITIRSVLDAPVAADDSYEVAEDDVLEVAAPGVLANDSDLEGRPLQAQLVQAPQHGSLELNSDGSFVYVPDDNFSGTDSFRYRVSAGGQFSAPATVTIRVLEVMGAGDVDLYVRTAKARLSWAGPNRDSLAIRGQINPRGIRDDLTGATVEIRLNNETILGPVSLDAAGRFTGVVNGMTVRVGLRGANGAYSVRLSGANLRETLGLANVTGAGLEVLKVQLRIFNASLGVPVTTARLEAPYKTLAGKSSAVKFSFRKNRTLSGVFNANKTTAATGKDGVQMAAIRGATTGEEGLDIVPTGDVEIWVGDAAFGVPLAQMSVTGNDYSYGGGGAPGVTRFSLRNSVRGFALGVRGALGLPGTGNGLLTHDLPVLIRVPTANGMVTLESVIELKRRSDASPKWKR